MSPVETLLAEVLASHAHVSTRSTLGEWVHYCKCGLPVYRSADTLDGTSAVRAAWHNHVAVEQAKALRSSAEQQVDVFVDLTRGL